MKPVLQARDVHKSYTIGKREIPVLRGVDLSIREGETFTILGGSGSGKSVCLKHVIGLLKPDAGRVVHRLEHIVDQGPQFVVHIFDRLSLYSKPGVRKLQNR